MAEKTFRITLFGKPNCDKCKTMNKRIDDLLKKKEYAEFEKCYRSLDTEDGLVEFCNMESINPQRIPAFVVSRRDPATGKYTPVPKPPESPEKEASNHNSLYAVLGLQTDYAGTGTVPPKMIGNVLSRARLQE